MENRNIYKLDDVLLVVSVILLAPAVYFAWPWLKGIPEAADLKAYVLGASSLLGPRFIYVLSYFSGSVITQVSGRAIRYQEKLSLKILDEVGYARKVRISEMSSRLGMSEQKVEKLVRKLSRVKSLDIGIEGDRIVRHRNTGKSASSPIASRSYEPRDYGSQSNEMRVDRTESAESKRAEVKEKQEDLRAVFEKIKNGDKVDFDELRRKGFNVETQTGSFAEGPAKNGGNLPFGGLKLGLLVFLFLTPLWPIPLVIFIRKAVKMRGMSQSNES